MFSIDLPAATPGHDAVLLPGNGMAADFYAPLGRLLASRGVSTRLLTLPGYDGTTPLPEPSWTALVEAVLPMMQGRGILIGHSLGGLLAVLVAARLRQQLSHLVLLEPAVLPWRWLARYGAWLYSRRVVEADRSVFQNRGAGYWRLHDPARFPRAAAAIERRSSLTSHRPTERLLVATTPDLYPLPLTEVDMATLLIRGASSGMSQRLGQGALAKRLARARCAVVPEAGHWLANEQDERLAELIAAFVSRPPEDHAALR